MTEKLEGLTRMSDVTKPLGPNPLKGKKLKVIIPEGTHTIYDHINPDGSIKQLVPLYRGDMIDAERVSRAQEFIDRGQMEVVA